MTERVDVVLSSGRYSIMISDGLLGCAGQKIQEVWPCRRALIVADASLTEHYLPRLQASLIEEGIAYEVVVLPAGESTKSFASLQSLLEKLLAYKPDRNTPLIALGGGVIGDITGFAASILLRGIPFIQIPTTLLAMVDSSVGGKTGINTDQGKNLVGSFYQPLLVLMDTEVLATLPARELKAGYAEVVKYGCILDAAFFATLEKGGMEDLSSLIATSCRIKAGVVAQDERETGEVRALLNFGHSFGHAMEAECGYDGSLLHGEAVGIGMVMAADLSESLGICAVGTRARIQQVLQNSGLKTSPQYVREDWNLNMLMQRMQQDKKNRDGYLRLILLRGVGEAVLTNQASEADVRACWERFLAA